MNFLHDRPHVLNQLLEYNTIVTSQQAYYHVSFNGKRKRKYKTMDKTFVNIFYNIVIELLFVDRCYLCFVYCEWRNIYNEGWTSIWYPLRDHGWPVVFPSESRQQGLLVLPKGKKPPGVSAWRHRLRLTFYLIIVTLSIKSSFIYPCVKEN